MQKPRKGRRGIYRRPTNGDIGFIVHSVEGNLCWVEYDNEKGSIQPFIWVFKDGYNTLHDWGPFDALPAQAGEDEVSGLGG